MSFYEFDEEPLYVQFDPKRLYKLTISITWDEYIISQNENEQQFQQPLPYVGGLYDKYLLKLYIKAIRKLYFRSRSEYSEYPLYEVSYYPILRNEICDICDNFENCGILNVISNNYHYNNFHICIACIIKQEITELGNTNIYETNLENKKFYNFYEKYQNYKIKVGKHKEKTLKTVIDNYIDYFEWMKDNNFQNFQNIDGYYDNFYDFEIPKYYCPYTVINSKLKNIYYNSNDHYIRHKTNKQILYNEGYYGKNINSEIKQYNIIQKSTSFKNFVELAKILYKTKLGNMSLKIMEYINVNPQIIKIEINYD